MDEKLDSYPILFDEVRVRELRDDIRTEDPLKVGPSLLVPGTPGNRPLPIPSVMDRLRARVRRGRVTA